jgi:protein-S-isoprenylcysteine O-methyltransferase Ste14
MSLTLTTPARSATRASLGSRVAILVYGVVSYTISLGVFAYLAGFVGGFLTPTRLDGPLTGSLGAALAIDLALVVLFALQHSRMARPAFKRGWTRLVPPAAERSTYMVATNVALAVLFALWRPMGGEVWTLHSPIARTAAFGLYGIGWVVVLTSTFLLNHFDLFGLRQVWLHFRGRPYTSLPFRTPGFYRIVRHPLYVGWTLVFWATPTMSLAHLLFAVGLTAYMLVAISYEEPDLIELHPQYVAYRQRVPMLVPRLIGRGPR